MQEYLDYSAPKQRISDQRFIEAFTAEQVRRSDVPRSHRTALARAASRTHPAVVNYAAMGARRTRARLDSRLRSSRSHRWSSISPRHRRPAEAAQDQVERGSACDADRCWLSALSTPVLESQDLYRVLIRAGTREGRDLQRETGCYRSDERWWYTLGMGTDGEEVAGRRASMTD